MDYTAVQDYVHQYVPRFVTNPRLHQKMTEPIPSAVPASSPESSWTRAVKGKNGDALPQIIAHRGFRSRYPENTMLAFKEAVVAGTEALETDLHISKDEVAVISHDASLKRCFGKSELIADHDWNYLSSLRTVQAPHEAMPRLKDLLEYLSQPGLEQIWLLLDIKMDDDPDLMLRCIASAINSVPPPQQKPWNKRIVLGIWALKYLPPCAAYLPDFAISHIGFSTAYARMFLTPKTPNVTFNMFYTVLMTPFIGPQFIADSHAQARAVYAWTVNDERNMRWCIEHGLDGVITDDVTKFVKTRNNWEKGQRKVEVSYRTWIFVLWVQILTATIGWWLRRQMEKRGQKRRMSARRS